MVLPIQRVGFGTCWHGGREDCELLFLSRLPMSLSDIAHLLQFSARLRVIMLWIPVTECYSGVFLRTWLTRVQIWSCLCFRGHGTKVVQSKIVTERKEQEALSAAGPAADTHALALSIS